MNKYMKSIERRLNLPKDVKSRVMADLTTTISAMTEAGKSEEEIRAELGTPKKVAAELNEQMQEFAYRKSPWRFVFLAVAVLSGLWLAAYRLALWLFQALTGASLVLSPGNMSVIGGADGPTSIFIATTSTSGFDWDLFLITAIFVICTAAFLRLRKCKPKGGK